MKTRGGSNECHKSTEPEFRARAVERVERLELSAFPVFTSIILHCHDLHVYSMQQNCYYTNQTASSTTACLPGSRHINRLSKHINEQIHPQRAMTAVIAGTRQNAKNRGWDWEIRRWINCTFHSSSASSSYLSNKLSPLSISKGQYLQSELLRISTKGGGDSKDIVEKNRTEKDWKDSQSHEQTGGNWRHTATTAHKTPTGWVLALTWVLAHLGSESSS